MVQKWSDDVFTKGWSTHFTVYATTDMASKWLHTTLKLVQKWSQAQTILDQPIKIASGQWWCRLSEHVDHFLVNYINQLLQHLLCCFSPFSKHTLPPR